MYPKNPDSGVKPIFWNDGVLFLGFCYDEEESRFGITLMFYDTIGDLLWSKRYLYPSFAIYVGYDILAFNNSSFYIGGTCRKTWDSYYRSFYAKFNNLGDSLFSVIYPDSANKAIMCMEKFSEDTILLCSKWDEDLTEEQKIVIEKIDTNGFVHSFNVSEYDNKNPEQILKTPHDLIFVGGIRKTDYGNIKVFLNVYDLSLNFLYMVIPSQSGNEYFSGLTILNNTVYLAANIQVSNPQPYWDRCRVSRLLPIGLVSYSIFVGRILWDLGVGNIITLNNNCMVVPISSWYLPHNSTFYFLDTNMSVICSTYVECPSVPDNLQWFGNIAPVRGNKIAGSGMIWPDPYDPHLTQDHWNFLTTSVQEFIYTHCNDPIAGKLYYSAENIVKDKFSIFPNPFRKYITIEDNRKNKNDFYIHIYNYSGVLVYNSIGKNKSMIDLESMASGLYFVSISGEDVYEMKKIIKN